MASSYSDNLKIELITDGEQAGSWGSTTNTNWEMIEAAVSAKQIVNITTDDSYFAKTCYGVSLGTFKRT